MMLKLLLLLWICQLASAKIKIALAGFPRSGTMSVSLALQKLGYETCHGSDMVNQGKYHPVLHALAEPNVQASLDLAEAEGCEAIFEFHGPYWREIRELRPDIKWLVRVREYEAWESSMRESFKAVGFIFKPPLRWIPLFDLLARVNTVGVQHSFGSSYEYAENYLKDPFSPEGNDHRKKVFDEFVRDGTQFAKDEPNRAMLLSLKDGYGPLCDFLDIDRAKCPEGNLPHANAGWQLKLTVIGIYLFQIIIVLGPFLLIWGVWKVVSKFRNKKVKTG